MWSFKKKKQPEIATAVAKKDYPAIVYDIHNEFMSAGDTILAEAMSILEESKSKNIEKGKRLAELGFKNCPEAVNAIIMESKIITTKEIAELVEYYAMHYPDNKFITEEKVKAICEKYGLVLGSIGWYKGFVPEKQLNRISGFKIRQEDDGIWSDNGMFFENGEVRAGSLSYSHIYKKEEKDMYRHSFQSNNGVDFYSYDRDNIFGMKAKGDVRFSIQQGGLLIAAPINDMKISSNYRQSGYGFEKIIPDPVVMRRVKGGYLILAAWGDEASDEDVVNQKMN